MAWDGVASSHLPRSLSPPSSRRGRRGEVVVRLREHPPGGTLHDVLAAGHGLTAGEAVTVLAAVARGLSELHRAGFGGVGLELRDVGLREDGCPVLTDIDRLRELDQGAMGEDVAGFAALAATLCGAVTRDGGGAVLAAATDRRHRSWEDVVAGVLRAADPTAVRPLGPVGPVGPVGRAGPVDPMGSGGAGISDPMARGDPAADAGRVVDRGWRHGAHGGRHDLLGVLERALDVLGDRPIARGVAVAREWIAARPKVVAVACSPLVAVVVLLVFVPGQEGPS